MKRVDVSAPKGQEVISRGACDILELFTAEFMGWLVHPAETASWLPSLGRKGLFTMMQAPDPMLGLGLENMACDLRRVSGNKIGNEGKAFQAKQKTARAKSLEV